MIGKKKVVIAALLAVALLAIPAAAVRPCTWNHGACVGSCMFTPGTFGCGDLNPAQRANCCAGACNDGACYNAGPFCGVLCPDGPPECNNDGDCEDGEACEAWRCVPVSCPAIPCDAGYECEDNLCVPVDPCSDVQCGEGYHCEAGECVEDEIPDPCSDIQCPAGFSCEGGQCVPVTPGEPDECGLSLVEKDPATWEPVVRGAYGSLGWDYQGEGEEAFTFEGYGLTPSTGFSLIYYPDPWPGVGLMVLGTGTSGEDGALEISGAFDFDGIPIAGDTNAPGAKIWVVLTGDVGADRMTGWHPTEYLFEAALMEACTQEEPPGPGPKEERNNPFSNGYWGTVGECDGILNFVPTSALITTRGEVVVHAMNKYPGGAVTGLDGLKVFYLAGGDHTYDPACGVTLFNGQCAGEKREGPVPTITVNNPEDKLRAIVCKDEGTAAGSTLTMWIRRGGEELTFSSSEDCIDVTVDLPPSCADCRLKPGLGPLFRYEWFAPITSPAWARCPAAEE